MRGMLAAIALLCWAGPLAAEGERAGDFDYYVLALSWSPGWCALEGDARDDPQCDSGRGFGFVLHGLWPQYEDGWPSFCRTVERDPSRALTAGMADIMGSAGPAFYQWKKHGRCSGLSAEGYFAASREAYQSIVLPDVLSRVREPLRLPASVVEDAFLEANPALDPDGIAITCRDGLIQEARICLNKALEPRECGADVLRACRLRDAILEPIR